MIKKTDIEDLIPYSHIPSYKVCDDAMQLSEETGGMSGGNCWNDDAPTPYTETEDRVDLSSDLIVPILQFVEKRHNLTLSFTDGISLSSKLSDKITHTSYTQSEYYGNSTDYRIFTLELSDINNVINEFLLNS